MNLKYVLEVTSLAHFSPRSRLCKNICLYSGNGWGLLRLASILAGYDYQCVNLLSCMTLDIENCHATVHATKVNMSKLEYARSFGVTMKESIKRAAHWAAYYQTSRRSWHLKPNTTVSLKNLLLMTPLPAVSLTSND